MIPSIIAGIRPGLRFAWRGPSLLVVTPRGECGAEPFSGYYFRAARHLSRLRLTIDGEPPYLCTLGGATPNEIDLVFVHPELREWGRQLSRGGARAGWDAAGVRVAYRPVAEPGSQ